MSMSDDSSNIMEVWQEREVTPSIECLNAEKLTLLPTLLETHIHLRPYSKRLLVSPQELKVELPETSWAPSHLAHIEDLRFVVGFVQIGQK